MSDNNELQRLRADLEQTRAALATERAARQRSDRIVAAARVAVAGGGYEQLVAAIREYDRLVEG